MKIFIAAVLILVLLIGGVTANTLFLKKRLDTLIGNVLTLPATVSAEKTARPEALQVLQIWEETRPIAAITVSAARLEKIDAAIIRMKTGWKSEDSTAYAEAREELLFLLHRLRAMESCSLLSII